MATCVLRSELLSCKNKTPMDSLPHLFSTIFLVVWPVTSNRYCSNLIQKIKHDYSAKQLKQGVFQLSFKHETIQAVKNNYNLKTFALLFARAIRDQFRFLRLFPFHRLLFLFGSQKCTQVSSTVALRLKEYSFLLTSTY